MSNPRSDVPTDMDHDEKRPMSLMERENMTEVDIHPRLLPPRTTMVVTHAPSSLSRGGFRPDNVFVMNRQLTNQGLDEAMEEDEKKD